MRQMSFAAIEKRLAKKNSELQEVRAMRKKLAEREKEISADIETLQNQKVEIIFLQVKKEMKNDILYLLLVFLKQQLFLILFFYFVLVL